ncbi:hypothetical protein Tco_1468505 [Tanacetum coccineum]
MDLETAQTTTTAKLPILKQENGNSFKPAAQTTTNADGTLTTLIPGPVTIEEKVQKKNDVKARSMLLMALPNEHLTTFNQYKDAKTLFAAIQTRFGGNEATKKTHKTLSKLQNIISQLAILGENISQEDLNLKFLRSLSSEWNTHVVVWRNKPDLDAMSFDDLYNNFKIVEQEDLEQIHEDDIEEMDLKWQLALLSIRTRRFFLKTSRKITINGSDTTGYDKSKVNYMADDEVPTNMALMALSDSEFNKSEFNLATYKRGLASVEEQLVFYKKNEVIFCEQLDVLKRDISYKDSEISMLKRSQITDKSRKGVGFVSYNVVPPPHTGLFSPPNLDLSYSSLEEFQQPEFEGYGPKTSKSVSEDISNEVRESPDALLVEELVLDDKLEKKTIFPTIAKIEFVRTKQQEKPVRKLVKYAEMYRLTAITIKGKGWNMVPRAVLMKTGLKSLNIARPVNTAHPKTIVYSARPMLKAVNTARPNSVVVNVVRANHVNAIKASACWVWRPSKLNSASITLKRHNYVDARDRSKVIHKNKIKAMLTVDAQGT